MRQPDDHDTEKETSEMFSPNDMQFCADKFGAACGHGALAAIFNVQVFIGLLYFPQEDGRVKSWVNMADMEQVLAAANEKYTIVGRTWPKSGLALLQWEGPWTKPGVPPRVACMHRHWVAVRNGFIWDANLEEWKPKHEWEQFAHELMPPKATGYTIARGYEVQS